METGYATLVSEWAPGVTPTRARFLGRNRLIAALSCAVVIPEAATRSGSMNTAHWAARLSVPVYAFPGPVTSAASRGCHDLIGSGAARLATSATDVIHDLTADRPA